MRGGSWLLVLGIAATMATASGAAEERSSLATCGHYEELAAAKRALQEGDKASALIHLRNADALLSQCERESERAVQPADTEPTEETMVGGAEAPPTPVV
jgi:hypothetical protein